MYGYIVSSKENNTAAAIDPSREIYEAFLSVARENGLKIIKVIDTHQHADHVSGVAKLTRTITEEENVEALAHFSSLEEYNSENTQIKIHYLNNADNVEISPKISLKAIHTPGHTTVVCRFC